MKTCIFGDSGLLGQALVKRFCQKDSEVIGVSSSEFHFSQLNGPYQHKIFNVCRDKEEIQKFLEKEKPQVFINCVALTNLTDCEKSPDQAKELNENWSGWLSDVAKKCGSYLIHVSTDQVFDGKNSVPYTEKSKTNPTSVYGKTKLAGEEAAWKANNQILIARTNIVGFRGHGGLTFGEWLIQSLVKNEPITLFDDYVTSTIHVRFLAETFLEACKKKLKGLFNMASHEGVSKYQFGLLFSKKAGLDMLNVKKAGVKSANLIPPRPPYLALEVTQAEKALGKPFPGTAQTIDELYLDYVSRFKEVSHVTQKKQT